MKKYTTALIAASAATVRADCGITAFEELGNWYCQAVSHIKYTGLDIPGQYQAVSLMDSSGACDFTPQTYSGPIAPFDEQMSVHVRGPTQLKQFAVYKPASASTKKRNAPTPHSRRHGHQHLHKKREEEKRNDMVVATIDGKVVSWANDYFGASATSTSAAPAATTTTAAFVKSGKTSDDSTSSSSSKSSSSDFSAKVVDGDYERVAYYNAESQTADGVTFLGNYGGSGSGVWDATWGNSLSYLNDDATGGAASPTVLKDVLVGDDKEYSIWSDKSCDDDGADCGYYRPGTVAQQGFGGADKVFLFEFSMPSSGKTEGQNADMPAIWLLNSKIPRTLQYGDCSCWGSGDKKTSGGCGEFDVFEVLSPGSTKAKSTFHFTNSIGDSNYFDRPTSGTIKVAVVFQASSSTASIKVLDDSTSFSTSMTSAQVEQMTDDQDDLGLSSLMAILS